MPNPHHPVLSDEVINALECAPGLTIVDATVGSGGHAKRIAESISPGGYLIGVDRDPEQLKRARDVLESSKSRVMLVHNSYDEVDVILAATGVNAVDGVLLDLGVSQQHLDDPERGISFRFREAPLDLRFDSAESIATAKDLIATLSQEELASVFQRYGEFPGARSLARSLVAARAQQPIRSIGDLKTIVLASVRNRRDHNPMTLVLQALRIAVNDELGRLERGLEQWSAALRSGGRLAVISYHSLEDRIVKKFFRDSSRDCICPPSFPVCRCHHMKTLDILTPKPIVPTSNEIQQYPTARSAHLRVARRHTI